MSCESEAELSKNWPRGRETSNMRKYGITKQVYMQMHIAQGGKCAICNHHARSERNAMRIFLCIDHWYFN